MGYWVGRIPHGYRLNLDPDSQFVAAYIFEQMDGDIVVMPFIFGSELEVNRVISKMPTVISVELDGPDFISASIIWGPAEILQDAYFSEAEE